MDITTSIEQVAGILHRAGLTFETSASGDEYRLLFTPSEAVFIRFGRWDDDSVVISVTSPILQEIEPCSAGAAMVQSRLQEFNGSYRFAKFLWAGDTLIAAYDLLGDTLQAGELLNAIHGISHLATKIAEELEESVGGIRYGELLERLAEDLEEVEDE